MKETKHKMWRAMEMKTEIWLLRWQCIENETKCNVKTLCLCKSIMQLHFHLLFFLLSFAFDSRGWNRQLATVLSGKIATENIW